MPIRMVDDDNQQKEYVPSNDGGGRGRSGGSTPGGGCLTAFLPLLLKFIFKKPLIGIPLLLIAGFVVFKFGLMDTGQWRNGQYFPDTANRC